MTSALLGSWGCGKGCGSHYLLPALTPRLLQPQPVPKAPAPNLWPPAGCWGGLGDASALACLTVLSPNLQLPQSEQ